MQYKNLEEMIQKEYKLSKDIVNAKAYGDEEKLIWWEGRLDAWKWCMEQLDREGKIDFR